MIAGTASWMENNTPRLTADDALVQAEQAANRYCAQHGINVRTLKLVDTTAPSSLLSMRQNAFNNGPHWKFDFYSVQTGTVHIEVPETGRPRM
jgi:hypothetical protein